MLKLRLRRSGVTNPDRRLQFFFDTGEQIATRLEIGLDEIDQNQCRFGAVSNFIAVCTTVVFFKIVRQSELPIWRLSSAGTCPNETNSTINFVYIFISVDKPLDGAFALIS